MATPELQPEAVLVPKQDPLVAAFLQRPDRCSLCGCKLRKHDILATILSTVVVSVEGDRSKQVTIIGHVSCLGILRRHIH